jgi:hypothetical protein
MRESYGTVSYEQEFERGKKVQRYILSSLTDVEISDEDLEANLGNPAYWETIREKFIQVRQDPNEFNKITTLLDSSNEHLEKSRSLHRRFPYPYFYLALNDCIRADVDQAELSYLQLVKLEEEECVSVNQKKSPKLRKALDIHHRLRDQLIYEEECRKFNRNVSEGLSFSIAFGADLFMYVMGGSSLEARYLLFDFTQFFSSYSLQVLLNYFPLYPYFWPPKPSY